MTELSQAFGPVVDALEQLQVAYQLGGSVASSLYGTARTTMDVDLVADLDEAHIRPLVNSLGDAYYASTDAILDAVRTRSSFNLIHQDTMMKVDVFLPKDRAYDKKALARRRRDTLEGRAVFVATPEDVVLAKLEWFDKGGRKSERQWNDVRGVLDVQRGALDIDYMRRWAADLGLSDLLDDALG